MGCILIVFWFIISSGISESHERTIFLLCGGLGCPQCKQSEQNLSFFLLLIVVGFWVQLGHASAKGMQIIVLAVTEASSAFPFLLQYIRKDPLRPQAYHLHGQMLENFSVETEGMLSSSLCYAKTFCDHLEPKKLHWKTFLWNQGWLNVYNNSKKLDP